MEELIIIEQVLNEMKDTEKELLQWGSSWWETYENCTLPEEYFNIPREKKICIDQRIHQISPQSCTDEYQGVPLHSIVVANRFQCDISKIVWSPVITRNYFRTITFDNKGNITLSKKQKMGKRKEPRTKYSIDYNLATGNISIKFLSDSAIIFTMKNNIITKRYEGVEIIEDLDTNQMFIRITLPYKKEKHNADVDFKAFLGEDRSLEAGVVEIHTHKGNGKINGTYKISANKRDGIKAQFISRKGKSQVMSRTPLLENNQRTLLTSSQSRIIGSFTEGVTQNISNKTISFDSTYFSTEAILGISRLVDKTIKDIYGEIPIPCIKNKIDDYFDLISIKQKEGEPLQKLPKETKKRLPK